MAALPGTYHITARQGDRFARSIVYQDDSGNAIDLTGYSAVLTARRTRNGKLIVQLEDGDGITLGSDTGMIDLYVSALDTAAWTATDGQYALALTPPSGAADEFTLLIGAFIVTPDIPEEEAS